MKHFTNLFKILITFALSLVMYIFMYIAFEYDHQKISINNIIEFQKKYVDVIPSNDLKSKDDLYALSNGIILPNNEALNLYQTSLENKVYSIIDKNYNDQERLFNLITSFNKSHLDKETLSDFNELVSINQEDIKEYQKSKDSKLLEKITKTNSELLEIFKVDYIMDKAVIEAFQKAISNNKTITSLTDDCFTQQKQTYWIPDIEVSNNWCKNSGLTNCNTKDLFKQSENGYTSFTMNNPSKTSDTLKTFEYTSYSPNYIDPSIVEYYQDYTKDYTIYLEVFKQTINNINIYKYNAIPIKNDISLSCDYRN